MVSFGVLGSLALVSFIAALVLAFQVHIGFGLVMVLISPGGWFVVRAVGAAPGNSGLAVAEAVTAQASYLDHANTIGLRVGHQGVLETHARPVGRARFAGGTCDVHAPGGGYDEAHR